MIKKDQQTMGFLRHRTMKIDVKEKAVILHNKTTAIHFRGSGYSLESCPPAELSSASPDMTKLNKENLINKLTYQQLVV
jgi:hypothetical protein